MGGLAGLSYEKYCARQSPLEVVFILLRKAGKNRWKIEKPQQYFTNIFVFYAVDPMKRWKLASASTLTIIRGENVPSAKTTSPLASRSFYNDRPLPSP
jgi:hypothetical protein